ncbi:saccharopine dehydrogenase family protein, partial [Bacteroidota bacterium]
ITVGDIDLKIAEQKTDGHANGIAVQIDINDKEQINNFIKNNDVIISMLPASFHPEVARMCLDNNKHMLTASYVSEYIRELDKEARQKGIILANELGVDPGIDHMSAMKIIDRIKNKGGKILSFVSNTGGLVAPEYDNNPWNYKFTWSPRSVVLAGRGLARFIKNGRYKYIPYNKLFTRTQITEVPGAGKFEYYPNRDSLCYRETYKLDNIPTMFRGTLRRPGFSEAWDVFVQLGCTDDSYEVEDIEKMTWYDFLNCFLRYQPEIPVEKKLVKYLKIEPEGVIMQKLRWLGIFENQKIGLKKGTPAKVLQHLLEKKWKLEDDDKDMIVMQHKFIYELNGEKKEIISSMVIKGQNNIHTAMSITVGLPLAIATKFIMTGKIKEPGVHIPVKADYYEPILDELKEYGIDFVEEEKSF